MSLPDTPAAHDETPEQRRGVRFDPTINLGHLLTFFGFIFVVMAAWGTMDKRVTILEENKLLQKQIDISQDAHNVESTRQVKDVLIRLDKQVERLADRLDKTQERGRP